MADTRSKTVVLVGDGYIKEAKSTAAAITPGHLIERTSAGTVRVHATAGGNAAKLFAIENEGIGGTIDTAYANSSLIKFVVGEPGMEINALLKDGENVAIGDFLESGGNGRLQKHVADVDLNHPGSADFTIQTNQIVGQALTACNMSGSALVDPSGRFVVELV